MKNFLLSILAGAFIAIAGFFSTTVGSGLIGSICFCIGLILVVGSGVNLFTGKIGLIWEDQEKWSQRILSRITMLFGNILGVQLSVLGLAPCPGYQEIQLQVQTICEMKLSLDSLQMFVTAFWCGFLMWSAVMIVGIDNQTLAALGLCLCIIGFIQCGFNHSIANSFYFAINGWSPKAFAYFLIAVCGNTVGAILPAGICYFCKKPTKEKNGKEEKLG